MQEIDCIFCGAGPSEVVIRENGFEGRQCARCGLIFVSPRPSSEEIADLYIQDQAHLSAQSHVAATESRVNHAAQKYRLSVLRKHIGAGKTVVDIGAGGGSFVAEARRQGFDVQAVELNPIQAEFIRTKLDIPCEESLDKLRETSGRRSFDVVYFRDVISHFFDPISEFETINGALDIGGIVAFETGNVADMDHRYFRYFRTFQIPDHLFFFGEASLGTLLNRTGFELVTIRRWSILPQLRLVHQLRRIRGPGKAVDRQTDAPAGEHVDVSTEQGGAPIGRHGSVSPRKRPWFREAGEYGIYHFLPSRIGAVAPKSRRPQTTLVVAKKVRSV